MKRKIRLSESDLHRIVKESVSRVLNEIGDTPKGQFMLGRLALRKYLDNKDDLLAGINKSREIEKYAKEKAPYSPERDRFSDGQGCYGLTDPVGDYYNGLKDELDPNDIKNEKEYAAKYLKDLEDGKINTNYDKEEEEARWRAMMDRRLKQAHNPWMF